MSVCWCVIYEYFCVLHWWYRCWALEWTSGTSFVGIRMSTQFLISSTDRMLQATLIFGYISLVFRYETSSSLYSLTLSFQYDTTRFRNIKASVYWYGSYEYFCVLYWWSRCWALEWIPGTCFVGVRMSTQFLASSTDRILQATLIFTCLFVLLCHINISF